MGSIHIAIIWEDQMAWEIKCLNSECGHSTWASEIVDLLSNHRDRENRFVCEKCAGNGYIEKRFSMQEKGETWSPYLLGAIDLYKPESDKAYHPFVFLVDYDPHKDPSNLWFSYYKDLRNDGGRLKMGYGPGGPPVLDKEHFSMLLKELGKIGFTSNDGQ